MNVDMKTRKPLVLASVLLVLSVFLLVFSAGGSSEFIIVKGPRNQYFPALYNDVVVWEDRRNGNSDIYGYNLVTHEEFEITTDPGEQRNPALYEDVVVWEDRTRNAIYGYNLATHEEFRITTASGWKHNPAVHNNIVVWEDNRNGNWDIYGYNLSTKEEFPITTDPKNQREPALYNNIVVWEDERNDPSDIYGYNLETHEEFQIITEKGRFSPTYSRYCPAIYEDIVIWTETLEDIICGYNLSTSESFVFATARMDKSGCGGELVGSRTPQIYETIVVWVDCRNGNEDIYGYNLVTDQEFQVTSNRHRQHSPALSKDVVVWADSRNGSYDIYGCSLSDVRPTLFKSRTRILLLEEYYALVSGVVIGVALFMIGKNVWYIKKLSSTLGTPEVFKRKTSVTPLVVVAVYSLAFGLVFVRKELVLGVIWIAGSAFLLVMSWWSRRVPFVRITDDDIVLVPSGALRPTLVAWDALKKVVHHTTRNTLELFLSNGKKVTIDLSSLDGEEEVIQSVKRRSPAWAVSL